MRPIANYRTAEPMDIEELERLHTGTLLTRLQLLRSLHERPEDADLDKEELAQLVDVIAFKNTEQWRLASADVKAVLATREHLPKGSKEKRQQSALRRLK